MNNLEMLEKCISLLAEYGKNDEHVSVSLDTTNSLDGIKTSCTIYYDFEAFKGNSFSDAFNMFKSAISEVKCEQISIKEL